MPLQKLKFFGVVVPLSSPNILEKLTPIFRDVFDNEDVTPRPETVAADVDEWDSLSHIRLIVSIERAFGIKFTAAEAGGMKNVSELVALIQAKGA